MPKYLSTLPLTPAGLRCPKKPLFNLQMSPKSAGRHFSCSGNTQGHQDVHSSVVYSAQNCQQPTGPPRGIGSINYSVKKNIKPSERRRSTYYVQGKEFTNMRKEKSRRRTLCIQQGLSHAKRDMQTARYRYMHRYSLMCAQNISERKCMKPVTSLWEGIARWLAVAGRLIFL